MRDGVADKYIGSTDKTLDLDLLSSHFTEIEDFGSRDIEKGESQMQTNGIYNLFDIFKSVRIPVEELSSSGTSKKIIWCVITELSYKL